MLVFSFDGVESGLIWGEIIGLIAQAVGAGKISVAERIDKLSLVNFIVGHFNVREEEMLLIHAPLTILTIMAMLDDAKEKTQSVDSAISDHVSRLALSIGYGPDGTHSRKSLSNTTINKPIRRSSWRRYTVFAFES